MADGILVRAQDAVGERRDDLVELSETIHGLAELSMDEHQSAAAVADLLESSGFSVLRGVGGLPTAIDARFGDGELIVGLIAEYDALPEVGHACGHNLIAAASVGAALGLAAVADELDITVALIGTPAEELGGGKVLMLEAGVFDDLGCALMVHPWSIDRLGSSALAVAQFEVFYEGRSAHASAAPQEGINAGDALVVAQVAIGLLRQQLPPGVQVHGVVADGGQAANVIPAHTSGRFMARALSAAQLAEALPRIIACFEAGATATGASLTITATGPDYSHLEQDPDLLASFARHAEALGRHFVDDEVDAPTYSTDMGNISLALPSIHPLLSVDAQGSVNHQPAFAAACVGATAEATLLDAARSLAAVGVDAATQPALRSRLLAGVATRTRS
jgi:amidohydrolase